MPASNEAQLLVKHTAVDALAVCLVESSSCSQLESENRLIGRVDRECILIRYRDLCIVKREYL